MFQAHVLIIRKSKLHYTASGIITPIGVKQKFCASSWLITEINISKILHILLVLNRFACSNNVSRPFVSSFVCFFPPTPLQTF